MNKNAKTYKGHVVSHAFKCSEVKKVEIAEEEKEFSINAPFHKGGKQLIDDEGRVHEVQERALPESGAFYVVDVRMIVPAEEFEAELAEDEDDDQITKTS